MADGIRKIGGDGVYSEPWYREEIAKASRGNREHIARFERSFLGVLAKVDDEDDLRNDDRDDERDTDTEKGDAITEHPIIHLARLLVASGKFSDHGAALHHVLNTSHGAALLHRTRTHKAEKESQSMTSHTEFVRDVVKQYGVAALCKSMVQDQKSYGLTEHQLVDLITEEAQTTHSELSKAAAFSKLYTEASERGRTLRNAVSVAKAAQFDAFSVVPLVAGGEDTRDLSDESEAIEQLKLLGADKWPSASALEQFERAITDPANRELTAKAHRRPVAPAGGAYAWLRLWRNIWSRNCGLHSWRRP
jgi:hypothetical protein